MSSSNSGLTVQAQWSLNESGNDIISVAIGVLRAATSDNVQPLALLAAEAFGNTLPICQHTQTMVERLASKRHTSKVLDFLKAKIGYLAHDCPAQLASSQAGVRFLALAAVLISRDSNFQAAKFLESMIRETAYQNQLLPTIGQLKDLIEALTPKLASADFVNSVIGWETFLYEHLSSNEAFRRSGLFNPRSGQINALLKAFRSVHRLGETDTSSNQRSKIRIIAHDHIPWIIAFTKWCLGFPPQVIHIDGTELLPMTDSLVTLKIMASNENGPRPPPFEVAVVHGIDNPSQLINFDTTAKLRHEPVQCLAGTVSIKNFGTRRLMRLTLGLEARYNIICEALLYALTFVKSSLRLIEINPPEYQDYAFPVLPASQEIILTFIEYTGFKASSLPERPQYQSFFELEPVARYREQLRQQCDCDTCIYEYETSPDGNPAVDCLREVFDTGMANMAADIISIALFDYHEPIGIYFIGSRFQTVAPLREAVENIIKGHGNQTVSLGCIFEYMFSLVGVTFNSEKSILMASHRGQVIYPTLLDFIDLLGPPPSRLTIVPGCLLYSNQHVKEVVNSMPALSLSNYLNVHQGIPVTEPLNLSGSQKVIWEIEVGDDCLFLSIRGTESGERKSMDAILRVAAKSLLISQCQHRRDAPLLSADSGAFYISSPLDSLDRDRLDRTQVAVAAVAGNKDMQLFALAGSSPAVVKGGACLACCLEICRSVGYRYVIC